MMEKSINEVIKEVVDDLNEKDKLSSSERKFLTEATNGKVTAISVRNLNGPDFWESMSNPHNLGIMYIGEIGVWTRLIGVEEEESENETSEQKWQKEKNKEIIKYGDEMPELKPLLAELSVKMVDWSKYIGEVEKKMKQLSSTLGKNRKYTFDSKLEYCFKDLYSLMNQFGPLIENIEFDEEAGKFLQK